MVTTPHDDELARTIASRVQLLCGFGPDRAPGTAANDEAAAFVRDSLLTAGVATETLPLKVTGWRHGVARIELATGETIAAHPGPFSPAIDVSARLVEVSSADELERLDENVAAGSVLFVHGSLAAEQLTPRGYPWYSNAEHVAILERIEHLAPAVVVAATGLNPATTGALSPFPVIEDPSFRLPSAYITEANGARLLASAGEVVGIAIDSERFEATGAQPVGRLAAAQGGATRRVLVTSHLDTKHDTPGALDNATGVAVMLAVAELLAEEPPLRHDIEFIAFNGEDHAESAGEVAYLAAYPETGDIALVVNIDGAGLAGGPCAVSRYNLSAELDALVESALSASGGVIEGEPWFASDHAIFEMRGVPAMAITSADMVTTFSTLTHTAADVPEIVDADVLAEAARFIARVVRAL
jgi:aminopeptidase YwaD